MSGQGTIAEGGNEYRVPALQRALHILEIFWAERHILTANEIAANIGVSVSSIYRILFTLSEMGYLHKLAKNRYELGGQVISNGFTYLATRDIVEVAVPYLNALRDRTSLSCHPTIREKTDTLSYIAPLLRSVCK